MPAGLKLQSKTIPALLILIVFLLSACSRDNPLNVPEEYIEEPEAFCIENGPYSYFTLLHPIEISNTLDSLPEGYPRGYENSTIELAAPFLIKKSEITITPVIFTNSEEEIDSETNESDIDLILLEKTLDPNLVDILLGDEIAKLQAYNPAIITMSVSVIYPKNVDSTSDDISDENTSIIADLAIGKNTIDVQVTATINVPKTIYDCEDPLVEDEITEDDEEVDNDRVITYSQSYSIEINRNDISKFEAVELTLGMTPSENDQIGKIISINDDFLVIGSPTEDSDSRGIMLATDSLNQNELSSNSGAVYVFQKTAVNTWQFHSFIKSSNSEAGDLFGSAVVLDGNTLVVSALGESSIASGVHSSSDIETNNLKVNNSALNSGALYIYEFDSQLNTWSEVYYVKPEINTISDANYNKGFGSQLAIYNNKLLVSAPLEDSDNGNPSNSNQPDSGAVYIYNRIANNAWEYDDVLKAINPGAGDKFGSSISLNDDFYIVGAPFEDHSNRVITNNIQNLDFDEAEFEKNTRIDSGAVYVFTRSLQNNSFSPTAHIKSTNSDRDDYFGSSVSISNNILFIGAVGEDSNGKGLNRNMSNNDLADSGAVYVFNYYQETQNWLESTYIKANDSQSDALFGKFLSADTENLFISAPLFNSETHQNTGKTYFYSFSAGLIEQDLTFQVTGTSAEERFGSAIGLYGRNLAIGSSGFIEDGSGIDEIFTGKVNTYE